MKEEYEFQWDERKNETNIAKHGISFTEGLAIWDDPFFVQVYLTSTPEDRWAVIGKIAKNIFATAIITYRGETIRIISLRKSTKKEVNIYEKH